MHSTGGPFYPEARRSQRGNRGIVIFFIDLMTIIGHLVNMSRTPDPHRRARILEAARAELAKHGYKGLVIDEVAAAAGCAKGSVYLDFPSKQALASAVLAELRQEVGARFAEVMAAAPTPRDQLAAMLRFSWSEIQAEPLYARLMREEPVSGALRAIADQAAETAEADAQIAWLRALGGAGVASGQLRADLDLEALPYLIALMRNLVFHAELATAGRYPTDRLLAAMLDVFITGISANTGDSESTQAPRQTP